MKNRLTRSLKDVRRELIKQFKRKDDNDDKS